MSYEVITRHPRVIVARGSGELTETEHSLWTVVAADEIVVLDGGRIVERGAHAELLVADGRYAEFCAGRQSARGRRLAQ